MTVLIKFIGNPEFTRGDAFSKVGHYPEHLSSLKHETLLRFRVGYIHKSRIGMNISTSFNDRNET